MSFGAGRQGLGTPGPEKNRDIKNTNLLERILSELEVANKYGSLTHDVSIKPEEN